MATSTEEYVFRQVEACKLSCELDEYIYDVKAQEATEINDSGMRAQLKYLKEKCGLAWIRETLLDL